MKNGKVLSRSWRALSVFPEVYSQKRYCAGTTNRRLSKIEHPVNRRAHIDGLNRCVPVEKLEPLRKTRCSILTDARKYTIDGIAPRVSSVALFANDTPRCN